MKKNIVFVIVLITFFSACKNNNSPANDYTQLSPNFCADSAYSYIDAQCAFGPRTIGSEAHNRCAEYLVNKFTQFGAKTSVQEGTATMYDGTNIKIQNIIAVFNDTCPGRILISSHWDSRPWADNDSNEQLHHTPIDGANDGASGVGVMLELARMIQANNPNIGVEFICWDAEDCGTPQWARQIGTDDSKTWCLGSQYWATNHSVDGFRYLYGILLDMVGGRGSVFYKENLSIHYAPGIVDKVWSLATLLGYGQYFLNQEGGAVTDDHLQVNQSGIPCIDVISSSRDGSTFINTWHTVNDNVQNIDRDVLKAVGQTMAEVIYNP